MPTWTSRLASVRRRLRQVSATVADFFDSPSAWFGQHRVTGFALLLILVAVLLYSVMWIPREQGQIWVQWDRKMPVKDQALLVNEFRKTVAQIVAGVGALLLLYFTWKRIEVSREEQLTERFTRAIDQLGHDKIEVRLGGIYALERIARDSRKDHWTIVEVLCAFVRERASRKADGDPGAWKAPPTDVQAALTALGRRRWHRFEPAALSLSGLDLRGADLRGNFERANLSRSQLDGAAMRGAKLAGADLSESELLKTDLNDADLHDARLCDTRGPQVRLRGANLRSASMMAAWFPNANLRDAHLEEACLEAAHLMGACLAGARLESADLSGADLTAANLQLSTVTADQLSSATCSERARLPEHLAKAAVQTDSIPVPGSVALDQPAEEETDDVPRRAATARRAADEAKTVSVHPEGNRDGTSR